MERKKYVRWSCEDAVGLMVIDNPPVNALSKQVIKEIIQCMQEMKENEKVLAAIITGAGNKAFVGGGDIKGFPALIQGGAEVTKEFVSIVHEMINAVSCFPKPTIAAVNGLALGGGCQLVLACDITVASINAQFGLPEIKLGIIPGAGGTQRLPSLWWELRKQRN